MLTAITVVCSVETGAEAGRVHDLPLTRDPFLMVLVEFDCLIKLVEADHRAVRNE